MVDCVGVCVLVLVSVIDFVLVCVAVLELVAVCVGVKVWVAVWVAVRVGVWVIVCVGVLAALNSIRYLIFILTFSSKLPTQLATSKYL